MHGYQRCRRVPSAFPRLGTLLAEGIRQHSAHLAAPRKDTAQALDAAAPSATVAHAFAAAISGPRVRLRLIPAPGSRRL